MDSENVNVHYRDLQYVEHHVGALKSGFLETRPTFPRKTNRIRAHVLVAMLALKMTRTFENNSATAEITPALFR